MAVNWGMIAVLGGLGVGGYFLYKKMSTATQPTTGGIAIPADVSTCMQFKPNWTQGQCSDRLSQQKTALANGNAQIASLMALRTNAVAQGDYATVANLDKQLGPWQTLVQGLKQDYWNLTGQTLQ